MKFYTYIIRSSKDGKNYIGYTHDPQMRLLWHNEGRNVSTKHRIPFQIIYTKEFDAKKEAMRFEKWLKEQKGGIRVKELIKDFKPR